MGDYAKKAFHFIKPYLATIGIFFIAFFFLKLVETISFFSHEQADFIHTFILQILTNIIATSFFGFIIFIIYAIIAIFSTKGAIVTTSTLFALLFLTEIGLTIYAQFTGTLMDNEIMIRPIKETIYTIHSILHIGILIPIILISIGLFISAALFLQKKKLPLGYYLTILCTILIFSPFIAHTHLFAQNCNQPKVSNYITNKSWYCFQSCYDYLRLEWSSGKTNDKPITTDLEKLQQFVNDHQDWEVSNIGYPLDRKNNIQDVLSPYFQFQSQKPNIVIIVMESLGREWNEGVCFAPFIDSLSRNSLYWPNCLSTTSRSFGAVPALTASVPCGRKGFQFGDMPSHNSLFTILKDNGYETKNFYGGDFAFDCILDFLAAQNCDYLSPFYQEYTKNNNSNEGNWWGLHDEVMFDKSIGYLAQKASAKPRMDLFITISSHEGLDLGDKKQQENYITQIEKTLNNAQPAIKRQWQSQQSRAAAITYADDCVRKFIKKYLALPGGENTIFIITGDHASGLVNENRLSYHRTPLIIWSPLLTQTKRFPAVVTHNDVAPSIVSLLDSQGFITAPEYICWVGNALDVSPTFQSKARMLIIDYSHDIVDMVYDKYFYHSETRREKEAVFEINDNNVLTAIRDIELQKKMAQKMALYKYVNAYTYHRNRLTQHFTQQHTQLTPLLEYQSQEQIKCVNPTYRPSEKGNIYYDLMSQHNIPGEWQKIRVNVTADVQIMDSLWQNQQKNLIIICNGDNMLYPTTYMDKINKFFTTETVEKKKWYSMNFSKDFIVKNATNLNVKVTISTPDKDEHWLPNSEMNVKNVTIKILGIE